MKRNTGPHSDLFFDRNVCALDDFLGANGEKKKYDMAWYLEEYKPRVTRWKTGYGLYNNKDVRTRLITIEKNAARTDLEPFYSEGRRMVKGNRNTTDGERAAIHIPPNKRTAHPKLPVTSTPPEIHVDISIPKRLTFNYWEEGRDDGSKAMPHGAGSFELWSKLLDHEPAHMDELTHVLIDFQSPLVMDFDDSERGKTLYFIARWVSPTGEKGPWTVVMRVIVP
jgi:hypothetical protein